MQVDDQAGPARRVGLVLCQQVAELQPAQDVERHVDRHRHLHAELREHRADAHGVVHRLFRERGDARVARARHEGVRRQHAVLRVPRAGEAFHADEFLAVDVDFRLIPEFDPVIRDGVVEHDARGDRRRHAELQILDDLVDRRAVERFLHAGQHAQLLLQAGRPWRVDHLRGQGADQLHRAACILASASATIDFCASSALLGTSMNTTSGCLRSRAPCGRRRRRRIPACRCRSPA